MHILKTMTLTRDPRSHKLYNCHVIVALNNDCVGRVRGMCSSRGNSESNMWVAGDLWVAGGLP